MFAEARVLKLCKFNLHRTRIWIAHCITRLDNYSSKSRRSRRASVAYVHGRILSRRKLIKSQIFVIFLEDSLWSRSPLMSFAFKRLADYWNPQTNPVKCCVSSKTVLITKTLHFHARREFLELASVPVQARWTPRRQLYPKRLSYTSVGRH